MSDIDRLRELSDAVLIDKLNEIEAWQIELSEEV